ncbi:hypothetical protein HD806DRAFT_534670 [Xylariaceae sp. AK1471]|nr:hypothetical protein HD806DRAFT_534670 [Xylariaceae sp. AK1471]
MRMQGDALITTLSVWNQEMPETVKDKPAPIQQRARIPVQKLYGGPGSSPKTSAAPGIVTNISPAAYHAQDASGRAFGVIVDEGARKPPRAAASAEARPEAVLAYSSTTEADTFSTA